MNQSDYLYSGGNRGEITVRDYTKGGKISSSRTGRISGIKNGLEKINFDKVARGLVWVSLGLGALGLLAPRRVQRMVGVRCGNHTNLIRFWGARELMSALMLALQSRPNSAAWSRVAGDAMDLGLLGAAYSTRRAQKNRLNGATAFVLSTMAVDALTAAQLQRQRSETKRISALTNKDLKGRAKNGAFHVMRSITINRSPEELYQYWRNFENLPRFMYHLERVEVIDDRRSHWVAKAPAGAQVAWDAEITEDQPNERIAWQSTDDADVHNSGVVRFEPAPAGQGTVVQVEIEYRPPAGAVGKMVATLFGEEPGQQVKGDLNRFKQVIETGEVIRSDSVLHGLGQKMQRPARPAGEMESKRGKSFFGKFLPGKRDSAEQREAREERYARDRSPEELAEYGLRSEEFDR